MSRADKTISSICEQEYPGDVYNLLVKGSEEGAPIDSNSSEGSILLNRFAILPGNPTVTADVFFLNAQIRQRFSPVGYRPFETERSFNDGVKAVGMEMVFFEGWNDTVQKGKITPMTNEDWKKLFLQGAYKQISVRYQSSLVTWNNCLMVPNS